MTWLAATGRRFAGASFASILILVIACGLFVLTRADAGAASPPLTLVVTTAPLHDALLAPVTFTVSVQNRGRIPLSLDFPTSEPFRLQVRTKSGEVLYDSRTGHKPIEVKRRETYAVGYDRVASFVWDAESTERRSLAPGIYIVRVEMVALTTTLVGEAAVRLDAPVTIATVLAEKRSPIFTIEGTPERIEGGMQLRDATGTIRLSRRLGRAPQGTFVVRGSVERNADGTRFFIERFAPAHDNLDPDPVSTPAPAATAPGSGSSVPALNRGTAAPAPVPGTVPASTIPLPVQTPQPVNPPVQPPATARPSLNSL